MQVSSTSADNWWGFNFTLVILYAHVMRESANIHRRNDTNMFYSKMNFGWLKTLLGEVTLTKINLYTAHEKPTGCAERSIWETENSFNG